MNFSQLEIEIHGHIDSALASYWNTPGAGQMPKRARAPRETDRHPIQLRQNLLSLKPRNYGNGSRRRHERRVPGEVFRFAQRQPVLCDPKIANIAFGRAADHTPGFNLRKFGR